MSDRLLERLLTALDVAELLDFQAGTVVDRAEMHPILFPAPSGGYIDLERFRYREWARAPRCRSRGRGPYAMRHSFATWAIEEGSIPLPQLATIMGTSIRKLEDAYHRWLKRADERLVAAFDAYDERAMSVPSY